MMVKQNMRFLFLLLIGFAQLSFGQKNLLPSEGIPYRKGERWGVMNIKTKKFMIEPAYDSLFANHRTYYSLFPFYQDGKMGSLFYGNIDHKLFKGVLIPAEYEQIEEIYYDYMHPDDDKNGVFGVVQNGKKGLYDSKGILVLPPNYSLIELQYKKRKELFAKAEIFFTVQQEADNFSTGIFDWTTRRFVVEPKYNLQEFNSSTIDTLNVLYQKQFYRFLLTDARQKEYLVDSAFKLILVKQPIKIYDVEILTEVGFVEDGIASNSESKHNGFINYCPQKTKTKKFQTSSKIRYTLTDSCLHDYPIIRSKDGKMGLLTRRYQPNYKQALIEPIYDSIAIQSTYRLVFVIAKKVNDKYQYGIFQPGVYLDDVEKIRLIEPVYDEVIQELNRILLKKDGKYDILFPRTASKIFYPLKAESISFFKRYDCYPCPSVVVKASISPDLYYYIDTDGYRYYEE